MIKRVKTNSRIIFWHNVRIIIIVSSTVWTFVDELEVYKSIGTREITRSFVFKENITSPEARTISCYAPVLDFSRFIIKSTDVSLQSTRQFQDLIEAFLKVF
jgi:hypothetical protein